MTGSTQEDYAKMMLAGGRSVKGNRSMSGLEAPGKSEKGKKAKAKVEAKAKKSKSKSKSAKKAGSKRG
jgi:hypothetical protein